MTQQQEREQDDRDDRIRLVGGVIATGTGLVGVVIYPPQHYLWLPFALLVVLGVIVVIVAAIRLARQARRLKGG